MKKYKVMCCVVDPIYNESSEHVMKKFDNEKDAGEYLKKCKAGRFTSYYLEEEVENIEKIIQRKLVVPGIYRHFKHTEDGVPNNYMYATMFVSKPKAIKDFPKDIYKYKKIEVTNTETDELLIVCVLDDGIYHIDEQSRDDLVIYKSLYDGKRAYARPYNMFMSEVPEGEKNTSGQKYRFELVRY